MKHRNIQRSGVAVFLLLAGVLAAPADAITLPIVPKSVLQTYFQSGDKPTQQQFATFIDSVVNYTDDRYLLGLRQYDPLIVYQPGDTAIAVKRFGIGDTTPESPLGVGYVNPHTTPYDLAPDFSGHFGFAAFQLSDSSSNLYYGFLQLYMHPASSSGMAIAEPSAIEVQYLVYNDTPNVPVEMFAVPEPATALLLVALPLLRRRRR